MKRKKAEPFGSVLQKILVLLLLVLLVVIAVVTLWVFLTQPGKAGAGLRKTDPSPETIVTEGKESGTAVFSELGRLRAVTADVPPATVVVTPFFPYPGNDTAFYEELMQKTRRMRVVIQEYFAGATRSELTERGESEVKKDILLLLNAELMLGSVNDLYFSEYMFLE